ncbi:hypothetical protein Tco_0281580 [Tanacetum coccineum]
MQLTALFTNPSCPIAYGAPASVGLVVSGDGRGTGVDATGLPCPREWSSKVTMDEEEVSSDDNEMFEVKVLMALADDESGVVGKESVRNGEWVKLSIRKVHTLLEMEDNDERKSFLDYFYVDLNFVKEQRNNLMIKHRDIVLELNPCKE